MYVLYVLVDGHEHRGLPSFPTRRSSDLGRLRLRSAEQAHADAGAAPGRERRAGARAHGLRDADAEGRGRHHAPHPRRAADARSEEHTSELQSLAYLVCRLLLEKKKAHEA